MRINQFNNSAVFQTAQNQSQSRTNNTQNFASRLQANMQDSQPNMQNQQVNMQSQQPSGMNMQNQQQGQQLGGFSGFSGPVKCLPQCLTVKRPKYQQAKTPPQNQMSQTAECLSPLQVCPEDSAVCRDPAEISAA